MADDLQGMRVLLVGASAGIGRATAEALRDAGAQVVGAARRVGHVEDLGLAGAVRCDVREPTDCSDVVSRAVGVLGGLDALVYATGVSRLCPLPEADAARWQETLETNLVGAALIARAALAPLLEGDGRGRVVLASSDSSQKPYPGLVPYAASKAAIEALTEGIRNEYPSLRATYVVVGPTDDTEMGRDWDPDLASHWVERWLTEGYFRFATQKSVDVAACITALLELDDPPLMAEAINRAVEPGS